MKNIFKEGIGFQRIDDLVADKKVRTQGYKYVSKTDFKQGTQGSNVKKIIPSEVVEKIETKKSEKLERRKKLKEKQH